MKEYIDDSFQQGEPESKPVENEVLIVEKKPTIAESHRGGAVAAALTAERPKQSYNGRTNFRKRGRSHVVESFETAESQHINSHVYNTAGFESRKSIDRASLRGKNILNEAKGSSPVEEEVSVTTTTTTTTTTEAPITDLPETTTTVGGQETTPSYETTSVLPTDREITTAIPTLEAQSEAGDDQQFSTEQFYDDEPEHVQEELEENQQGIFADVKKQLSDLLAMAENDPETEEIEDDEEHFRQLEVGGYHEVDLVSTEGPSTTTAADMAASENRPEPVTEAVQKAAADDAMGPMAIPTSTSNGITHETEICYRGRCIKTDEKKPRKNKFKPN